MAERVEELAHPAEEEAGGGPRVETQRAMAERAEDPAQPGRMPQTRSHDSGGPRLQTRDAPIRLGVFVPPEPMFFPNAL